LHQSPRVISKLTLSVIPPRYYSSESLTLRKNPLAFFSSPPRSLPRFKQYPRERKGWRGLPAAREVRRGAGLAPGGSDGHNGVRLDGWGGRNRPVHVRRRVLSSAAGVPAKPRRSSSIQWHDKLHGVIGYLCIESKNGAVTYPVHVHRRGSELRRARFRYSGGAGSRFKLVQASRPLREAIRGLGPSGGGRERGWPRWLLSGGSGGSRDSRRSYGRARGS
jgi:hypothetical protein